MSKARSRQQKSEQRPGAVHCQGRTADGAPFSPCLICILGWVNLTTSMTSRTLESYWASQSRGQWGSV